MAYDDGLAERIREGLAHRDDVIEKKMFGGLAFMVSGHLCVGILADALMARVGPEAYPACLSLPYAGPMEFTGRPMTGFVQVQAGGIGEDDELINWLRRCESFVDDLPPK